MSKVMLLIAKEQKESLQDVCKTLESALTDDRKVYPTTIIDEKGSHNHLSSRAEFLEDVIEWALNILGANFDFLE